jgi:hypothetical protein
MLRILRIKQRQSGVEASQLLNCLLTQAARRARCFGKLSMTNVLNCIT